MNGPCAHRDRQPHMPIARVALPVAADTTFDYWAPEALGIARGSIVRVRLGPRKLIGVVIDVVAASESRRRSCRRSTPSCAVPPLSGRRARDGGIRRRLLPGTARHGGRAGGAAVVTGRRAGATSRVDAARAAAAAALSCSTPIRHGGVGAIGAAHGAFAPFLLFGVTGSGKTDVYLDGGDASDRQRRPGAAAGSGDQPDAAARARVCARALPRRAVALLHSGLADGERRAHWRRRRRAKPDSCSGTRLAVFAPMPALALVIVDEEQDASYKQQDTVRYHARDVAVWRAHRRERARRAGQRDAVAGIVAACARRPLSAARPAAARRSARRDAAWCASPATAPARALEGVGEALRDAIGGPPGARRAVAGVRQSPRILAVAAVFRLRLGSGLSALQRAAHRPSRAACVALPSLRP